jgi:hypothetical protein
MVWLAVPFGVALIGIVLASTLYRPRASAPVTAPAVAGIPATLDQHERHADLFAPNANDAVLPDALDRWLAARER